MSLFKARTLWSCKLGAEAFAEGGMVAGDVTNDGSMKIVTGSLAGKLRIHDPALAGADGCDELSATLLELQLEAPVLQLALGRLMPHDDGRLALAVLHPHKLAVYSVEARSANDDADDDDDEGERERDKPRAASHHELSLQRAHPARQRSERVSS